MSDRIVDNTEQELELTVDEELSSLEDAEEQEVKQESKEPSEEDKSIIPDKFKDKSIEDIVQSYTKLEKEFGRKSNEVGELRKLTDEFLKLQLDKQEQSIDSSDKDKGFTFDDLVDNPSEAIQKALDNNPEFKSLKEQLTNSKRDSAKSVFESKHPDWQEVVQSDGFQDWVAESKIRTKMFQEANQNYDYETGDEIFQLYKDTHNVKKEAANKKREEDLKAVTTETGSTGVVKQKVYRRADLVKLRMQDPQRFDDMQDEILLAYKEGRVR